MKSIYLLVLGAFGLLSTSCENELDVTAPYKETAVVYGLINPLDSIHYVRIQKAFLGDGNLTVMSQIPDSTYYPDILNVNLVRIKDGSITETIPMTRFVGPPKDAGEFPSSPNILYKTNGEKVHADSDYRLVVQNTQTGNVFYAQSPMVDSMKIIRPAVNNFNGIPFNSPSYVVEFAQAKDARVYGLTIRFHYDEEDLTTGQITSHYIDWVFPNQLVTNPNNITAIEIEIVGENFYKFVGEKLDFKPNVNRYDKFLDFYFVAGAEFLSNYILINQATTSILTSVPEYSNVTGGTGIFSSRSQQASLNKPLSSTAKSLLTSSPYTAHLGFQ